MFRSSLAALLLMPLVLDAQGRRTFGRDNKSSWDSIQKAAPSVPSISKRDLQSFSGIKLVVDKRKDLKLSDDQVKQFSDLSKTEDAANEGRFTKLDSLKLAMKPRAGEDAEIERARTSLAREELMTVIKEIRASYDSTFQVGLPLLDDTQKKSATQLLDRKHADAEEDLRSKLRGKRGR